MRAKHARSLKIVFAAVFCLAAAWLYAGSASSGEHWKENLRITNDAVNREADYLRRSQNRTNRDINAVNETKHEGWAGWR